MSEVRLTHCNGGRLTDVWVESWAAEQERPRAFSNHCSIEGWPKGAVELLELIRPIRCALIWEQSVYTRQRVSWCVLSHHIARDWRVTSHDGS